MSSFSQSPGNNRKEEEKKMVVLLFSSKCHSLRKRAQSTISICALIVLFTILLFMLCTFDSGRTKLTPSTPSFLASGPKIEISLTRRWLSLQKSLKPHHPSPPQMPRRKNKYADSKFALHGLGTLFMRGSKGMNELIIAHVTENTHGEELRWFLRLVYRSGLLARSDLVLIFPSTPIPSSFINIIIEENISFKKLLSTSNKTGITISPFDPSVFHRPNQSKVEKEPIWGLRSDEEGKREFFWGSVVGFQSSELNPEDDLAGFLDFAPLELRRWACYQMLLGKVRRSFKHVLLVDVKRVMLMDDVFAPLRKQRNSEPLSGGFSLFLWRQNGHSWGNCFESVYGKHAMKSLEKWEREFKLLNSAILMGEIRAVKRLSNAMSTEIVRVAVERKSRRPFSDSALLTYLVHKTSFLKRKDIRLVMESIPPHKKLALNRSMIILEEIVGDENLNLISVLQQEICSALPVSSFVYSDCSQRYKYTLSTSSSL